MEIGRAKKSYYLISKTVGQTFSRYRGNQRLLSEGVPCTVDEVIVGNKNNPNEIRKIITFKDKKGKIQERIFDYSGMPVVNKVFGYKRYVIGKDEQVDLTSIKEYTYDDSVEGFSRSFTRHNFLSHKLEQEGLGSGLLKKIVSFFCPDKTNPEPRKSGILSSIMIDDRGEHSVHDFVQYRAIGAPISDKPKELSFGVNKQTYDVLDVDNLSPELKEDSFLGLRAYDIEDSKIPFVNFFMRKRKLQDVEIDVFKGVEFPHKKDRKKLRACFCNNDGAILFNKEFNFKSKASIVDSSSHEVEHLWQWFLHSRNNGGITPFGKNLVRKFGPLTNPTEIMEADMYSKFFRNYTDYSDDPKKYAQNYIEMRAFEKGRAERLLYEDQGQAIRREFPHIPPQAL